MPGSRTIANSRIRRSGLKRGERAPDFNLPTLDGRMVRLSEFLGHRFLLFFSDPECGPCSDLIAELERLHRQLPAIPILMITRGSITPNRSKARERGVTFEIARQKCWEVSRLYAMFATPVGYLIDSQGIICADVAIGKVAILGLFRAAAIMWLLDDDSHTTELS